MAGKFCYLGNWFKSTGGIFRLVPQPNREPDFLSYSKFRLSDYLESVGREYNPETADEDAKERGIISSTYWYGHDSNIPEDKWKAFLEASTEEEALKIYQSLRKDQKKSIYVIRKSHHWCYGYAKGIKVSVPYHLQALPDHKRRALRNHVATCKWFLLGAEECSEELACGKIYLHELAAYTPERAANRKVAYKNRRNISRRIKRGY